MPKLDDAILLAAQVHHGQTDRAGAPYILHPLRVMFRMETEAQRTAAVLHDVVEDSATTLDDLRRMGYSEQIVQAVDCLSRREGEDYMDLIRRAGSDPVARRVKLADLEDNMDIRRYAALDDKSIERLKRYHRAWMYLQAAGDASE